MTEPERAHPDDQPAIDALKAKIMGQPRPKGVEGMSEFEYAEAMLAQGESPDAIAGAIVDYYDTFLTAAREYVRLAVEARDKN